MKSTILPEEGSQCLRSGIHLIGSGLVRMVMKAKQASAAAPESVFDEAAS